MELYLTLRVGTSSSGSITERRSRFVAALAPVSSEEEAHEWLDIVRAQHGEARHHVLAWRLADGRERTGDDGEPTRSAGAPTLEVLRSAHLRDVCCVTARYFGGTLLGTGGLARAYADAARRAVQTAQDGGCLVEMAPVVHVAVRAPYGLHGRVARLATECGGRVDSTAFAEEVTVGVRFRAGEEHPFLAALAEIGSGQLGVEVGHVRIDEI